MRDIDQAISAYSAFFHRQPDSVVTEKPEGVGEIAVARYPAIRGGFFKKVLAQLPSDTVWITSGMSRQPMSVPEGSQHDRRIEISAVVPGSHYYAGEQKEDLIAELLLTLASYPFENNIWFGVGTTLTFPEPLLAGSGMNCVLFGVLDCDLPRLCKFTPGKAATVISVMPITSAERDWYESKNDLLTLIDQFETNGVGPYFDPHRASVV